jgi:hypothetical protein
MAFDGWRDCQDDAGAFRVFLQDSAGLGGEQLDRPAQDVLTRHSVGRDRLTLSAGPVEVVRRPGIVNNIDRAAMACGGTEHAVTNCGRYLFVIGSEENGYPRVRLVAPTKLENIRRGIMLASSSMTAHPRYETPVL